MNDPFLQIIPARNEQDAMKDSINSVAKVRNAIAGGILNPSPKKPLHQKNTRLRIRARSETRVSA
jgi:hypothetical protein